MKRFSFSLILLIAISCPVRLYAQSFRYMDESGNIHFVDSIYQIPPRYRNQVLQPTPAPTGKVKLPRLTPTPRPTRTPRPTKTPKIKKTKEPKAPGRSFFPGSYNGAKAPPTVAPVPMGRVPAPPIPQQRYNPLDVPPGQFPPEYAQPPAAPPIEPTKAPVVDPAPPIAESPSTQPPVAPEAPEPQNPKPTPSDLAILD